MKFNLFSNTLLRYVLFIVYYSMGEKKKTFSIHSLYANVKVFFDLVTFHYFYTKYYTFVRFIF